MLDEETSCLFCRNFFSSPNEDWCERFADPPDTFTCDLFEPDDEQAGGK